MRRAALFCVLALTAAGCGLKVPIPEGSGTLTAAGASGGNRDGGSIFDTTSGDVAGDDASSAGVSASGASAAAAAAQADAAGDAGAAATTAKQRIASIFPNDTEGVTDKTIKLCAHVPITGAAPLDRNPNRFAGFYFDYVNKELGGIHGRKIEYKVYDDQYNPPYAVQAAERCKAAGTFLFLGAAGTDQIVAVAKWAQKNKVPYLMGPVSIRDVKNIPYAKMIGPSYEYQHELLADYLFKRFGTSVKYGMVRINSPFFDEAHNAFVARLRTHGITLAVDEVVQKDENNFGQLMLKLQQNQVRVVNNFVTPAIWLKMLPQSPPNYRPFFTAVSPVAGYNLIADALATEESKSPGSEKFQAEVFDHFKPAYPPTGQDGNVEGYEYADEIRKFQAVFDRYTTPEKSPRDDFDWLAWLAAKSLHRLLLAAGPDLTRGSLWKLLETYKETPEATSPGCPADFTRAHGQGAWYVNILKLGTRQWTNVHRCVDRAP